MREDPLHHGLVITTATTMTVVTFGAAYVYDKKTGKLIRVWYEKEDYPVPIDYIVAALETLHATQGLKGVEELRTQAAKLLADSVDKAAAALDRKPTREVVEA